MITKKIGETERALTKHGYPREKERLKKRNNPKRGKNEVTKEEQIDGFLCIDMPRQVSTQSAREASLLVPFFHYKINNDQTFVLGWILING